MISPAQVRSLPRNLKVLIAEDNEVNQLLAKGIFRHWGIQARVAATGVEVMECIEADDYDLVLMDIQMPEKSGIEAAKDIRGMFDERKKNVPIIALTANGVKGEEKKYLAAGMNGYLIKPFNEEQLYEVVDRVLVKKVSSSHHASFLYMKESPGTQLSSDRLYDMSQLSELAGGSNDFLVSLANIFLQTIPQNSSDMLAAAREGNWDMASKLAHKLKSTIDSMNINSIKTDVRTIELDGKNKKNLEAIPALAAKVNDVLHAVAAQVKADYSL